MGTFNQQVSNLKDSWNIFTADFVVGTGLFDIAKGAIDKLTTFINNNKSTFIEWGNNIKINVAPKLEDLGKKVFDFVGKVQKLDSDSVRVWTTLFTVLASTSLAASIISNMNPVVLLFGAIALNAGLAYENTKKLVQLLTLNAENKALDKAIAKIANGLKMKDLLSKGSIFISPLKKTTTPTPVKKGTLTNPITGRPFANGGIIGGNSYGGDKVIARVNSGEMILNRGQQSVLFSLLKKMSSGNNVNFNAPISFGGQAGAMQQQNTFTNMLKNLAI